MPGFRDILAQLMAGIGGGGGGNRAPVGQDEYQTLLQRELQRYSDRDQAVRSANIAGGFGNSTAQQFMHPAAAAVDPVQTAAVPTPTPAVVPVPTQRPENAPIPVPTPAPRFSPDLAVSPNPYQPGSPVDPRPSAASNAPPFQGPPQPTQFPPDLAVSPPREPDRMSRSAPTGKKPRQKKGKRVGQYALEPDPARFGR